MSKNKEKKMTRPKPELLRECERVNRLLMKQAQTLELGTKKSLARLEEARQSDREAFSYWAQLEFQEYIRRQLEQHPAIHASLLINAAARLLKLSNLTTRRYLQVLRSGNGPFNSMGDIVILNPNYSEQDDYWLDNPVGMAEGEEA
jgi:hypothetical protein